MCVETTRVRYILYSEAIRFGIVELHVGRSLGEEQFHTLMSTHTKQVKLADPSFHAALSARDVRSSEFSRGAGNLDF